MEPLWEGRKKVYINGPGHMTKMAILPIYGKNLQKSSPTELKVLRSWSNMYLSSTKLLYGRESDSYMYARGRGFDPHSGCCVVSSKIIYLPESAGNKV